MPQDTSQSKETMDEVEASNVSVLKEKILKKIKKVQVPLAVCELEKLINTGYFITTDEQGKEKKLKIIDSSMEMLEKKLALARKREALANSPSQKNVRNMLKHQSHLNFYFFPKINIFSYRWSLDEM